MQWEVQRRRRNNSSPKCDGISVAFGGGAEGRGGCFCRCALGNLEISDIKVAILVLKILRKQI